MVNNSPLYINIRVYKFNIAIDIQVYKPYARSLPINPMRAQHIKIHYRLHSILKYIIDYRFNTLIFEFTECVAQHIIDYRFNTGIFEFTNKSG